MSRAPKLHQGLRYHCDPYQTRLPLARPGPQVRTASPLESLRPKREAEIWARHIELQIDRGLDNQRVPLLRGPCEVGCRLIDPLEIIERQPSAWTRQGRIFPHAAQSVSKAFQRATSSVGIEDLHFHDLRHDGASRLFEVGDTIEQVALVTGHRDWNMLRRRPN